MQKLQIIFSLLKNFLPTSRPRFWRYTLGSYYIGLMAGSGFTQLRDMRLIFTIQAIWFFLYFSYPANLLIYGVNDIFDYETDKNNPKKQDYEWLITPEKQQPLRFVIAWLNIPFLFLSILPNSWSYIWLFIFLLSSVFYSAPPIRAKARPILDTIASAFVYIAPWYVWYYLSGWTNFSWFIFVALLARNMAMHAYSAIPDIEADSQARISTVATLYGKQWTLTFCIICYTLSIICSLPYLWWFSLLWVIYIAMMLFSFKENIFSLYKYFPRINATVGFLLFWYIVALKIGLL